jgi:hypothetical protein
MFLPYMPMHDVVTFGAWELGPIANFDGRWANDRFKELSLQFVAAFRGPYGQPLAKPTLLAPKETPINGQLPSDLELTALRTAINFAALDANPRAGEPNAGQFAVTSDNSDLVVWPIDLADGFVAFGHVGAISRLNGGFRINEDLLVPAPLELLMPMRDVLIDPELLQATFDMAMGSSPTPNESVSSRLVTAISWLAQSWRNSQSIRPQDRIVLLKTGFEALSKESQNWPCAKRLRALYERLLPKSVITDDETDELLWTPSEAERFQWVVGGHTHQVTDLQQWLRTFGDTRNEIIHEGTVPSLTSADGTAYDGLLFNVGERLLRETIKVAMIELGFENMWRPRMVRLLIPAATELFGELNGT